MKLNITKGTTSKLIEIFIQDNSVITGAGLTGLVFNSSSLSAYYIRNGGSAASAISLVTMTLGTWVSGGFKEIDATNLPGWYQFGVPDALLASGADSVALMFKGAANMAPVPIEIQLTGMNFQDTVRAGLTALPNVAAGANGGLPIGDGSGRVDVGKWLGAAVTAATAGIPDVNAKNINNAVAPTLSGDAYARIGANGAGLTALGDTRLANLDATTSSRAPASTAVSNADYTSARAAKLDNLDAAVSSRSTYAGGDTSGTATLLGRIPGTVQPQTGDAYGRLGANGAGLTALGDTRLANLDAATSSRLPTSSYVAPDNATITAINTKTTNLPAAPASEGNVTSVGNAVLALNNISASQVKAQADQALVDVGLTPTVTNRIDATISSRSTLTAAIVWQHIIEGSLTAEMVMRILLSGLAGRLSGVLTNAPKFRDVANTKNRISATTSTDGRTSVTLDGS